MTENQTQDKQTNKNSNGKSSTGRNASGRRPRGRKPETKSNQQWDVTQFHVEPAPGKLRFHDLGFTDEVMHAIADLGISTVRQFRPGPCPIPCTVTM